MRRRGRRGQLPLAVTLEAVSQVLLLLRMADGAPRLHQRVHQQPRRPQQQGQGHRTAGPWTGLRVVRGVGCAQAACPPAAMCCPRQRLLLWLPPRLQLLPSRPPSHQSRTKQWWRCLQCQPVRWWRRQSTVRAGWHPWRQRAWQQRPQVRCLQAAAASDAGRLSCSMAQWNTRAVGSSRPRPRAGRSRLGPYPRRSTSCRRG